MNIITLVRLFPVVAEWGFGGLVLEITEVFHVTFSYATSCLSYVGGRVFRAVVTSDFIYSVFCVTLACQTCFASVACAVTGGARCWV